jgi:hypothetical protein
LNSYLTKGCFTKTRGAAAAFFVWNERGRSIEDEKTEEK